MNRRNFLHANTLGVMGTAMTPQAVSAQTTDTIDDPAKKLEIIEPADIVILGGARPDAPRRLRRGV